MSFGGSWCSGALDITQWEIAVVFGLKVLLSVVITTVEGVGATVGNQWSVWVNFITGQVVVTDEMQTWLVNIRFEWQLRPLEQFREGITAVIGVVHFTNLD